MDIDYLMEMTAFDLAGSINSILRVGARISSVTSESAAFEFDPETKSIVCSDVPVRVIAGNEKGNKLTCQSYEYVLMLAQRCTRECPELLDIPDELLYAVYCCLHEFGHLQFALRCSKRELAELSRKRAEAINQLDRDIQEQANRGLSEIVCRRQREFNYHSIFLEKNADEFADDNMSRVTLRLLSV